MTFLSADQLRHSPSLSQRGRASIDVLGSMQDFSSGFVRRLAKRDFESQLEGAVHSGDVASQDTDRGRKRVAEASRIAHGLASFRFERFLQRYVAEEVYYRGIPAVEERRDRFSNGPGTKSPRPTVGTLELDPDLVKPKYYTGVDWHLEPGGYDGYDLYGALFTHVLGPRVFKYGGYAAVGHREDITSHRIEVVKQLPKSSYRRIYDAGCGGFSTLFAAHKVFPEAELTGSDLSELLLRNGHTLAEQLGVPVTFKQRDSRKSGEPSGTYDAVLVYAVLHEMPPVAGAELLQEMFRILEPGGDIVISDPPPFRAVDDFQAVVLDWDTKHRGEPFFSAVGHTDWCQVLREIGFGEVEEYAIGTDYYPWVTRGTKPK